jgi:hypothetical protein
LGPDDDCLENIAGIKIQKSVKFLGIKISSEKKTTIEQAWNSINRHLAYIKGKLRYAEPIVREEVMGAYIRQLLIYFATPLVAASISLQVRRLIGGRRSYTGNCISCPQI